MNNSNVLLLSVCLAIFPFLVVIGTAYLKVNIVLNLFKNAIGAQQVPSGVIIGTISLAISLMVMEPVWDKSGKLLSSNELFAGKLEEQTISDILKKFTPAMEPWKEFVTKHAGAEELLFLKNLRAENGPSVNLQEDGLFLIITAFILSELNEAFQMGLMVLLPFLIIDFLIANFLAGLGMMMFSPILLSLPLKILLIVGLDFWQLIFKSLFLSYA